MPHGCVKFHVNKCNKSPMWGKNADFWPVSKFNTGSRHMMAIMSVISNYKQIKLKTASKRNQPETRMALNRVHTSAKAQQCPLIQSIPVQNQTHSHVTIKSILPGITVLGKMLMPVGMQVPNHFYFSAILCLCHCLLIKKSLFFYKKQQPPVAILFWVSCAILYYIYMCKLYYNDLQKLASTYSISSLNAGNTH